MHQSAPEACSHCFLCSIYCFIFLQGRALFRLPWWAMCRCVLQCGRILDSESGNASYSFFFLGVHLVVTNLQVTAVLKSHCFIYLSGAQIYL